MTNATSPGETFTSQQVCDIAGITYRQLDYWARTGLLVPSVRDARGQGSRRRFSIADMRCAVALAAVSNSGSGGHTSQAWTNVRRLVADAYRQRPWAEFVVVLDASEVRLCDTVEEVVAASRDATVTTVIWPDRIIWPAHDIGSGVVKLSAESETSSPPGASAAPSASSRPRQVASAALSP